MVLLRPSNCVRNLSDSSQFVLMPGAIPLHPSMAFATVVEMLAMAVSAAVPSARILIFEITFLLPRSFHPFFKPVPTFETNVPNNDLTASPLSRISEKENKLLSRHQHENKNVKVTIKRRGYAGLN